MAGKYGVQETREVLLFVKSLVVRVIKDSRVDGFSYEDFSSILSDPQVAKDFFIAVQGSDRVDEEVKELDFLDGVELSKFAYACVAEIIGELKGT